MSKSIRKNCFLEDDLFDSANNDRFPNMTVREWIEKEFSNIKEEDRTALMFSVQDYVRLVKWMTKLNPEITRGVLRPVTKSSFWSNRNTMTVCNSARLHHKQFPSSFVIAHLLLLREKMLMEDAQSSISEHHEFGCATLAVDSAVNGYLRTESDIEKLLSIADAFYDFYIHPIFSHAVNGVETMLRFQRSIPFDSKGMEIEFCFYGLDYNHPCLPLITFLLSFANDHLFEWRRAQNTPNQEHYDAVASLADLNEFFDRGWLTDEDHQLLSKQFLRCMRKTRVKSREPNMADGSVPSTGHIVEVSRHFKKK